MTIKVTTESGADYYFIRDNNNRLVFQRNVFMSGEVVRIKGGKISTGKSINMDFHKYDMYDRLESGTSTITTTPVKEIEVIF